MACTTLLPGPSGGALPPRELTASHSVWSAWFPPWGDAQCPYGTWGIVPGPSWPSPFHLEILPLSEPNDESGANVDASKMWRDDREQFYKVAKQIVQKSLGL